MALLATRPATADEKVPVIDGKLTLDGQPIADGTIVFHLDDDEFVGTRIKDGAYKVTRVPAGQWRGTITGRGVSAKVSLGGTSRLRVEIRHGRNTIAFDLRN